MQDQDRIHQRAYALWEKAGKPDGVHDEHWQQASREMEAEDNSETTSASKPVDGVPAVDKISSKIAKT